MLGGLLGGLIGGGSGGSGGGLLGGVGKILGSATSIIPNMISMGVSAHKAKEAEAMSPGTYSPLQMDLLEEIKSKKKALETGTAYAPQQSALNQSGLQAMRTAGNVAGGDVGMVMSALKGINRATGRNQNEMFGQMSQEGVQLSNLMNNLTQSMANRQYQISMGDKLQKLAEAKQSQKESQQGLRTSLSLGLDKMDIGSVIQNAGQLQQTAPAATTPSMMPDNNVDLSQMSFGGAPQNRYGSW
jgi:hypothetical protein